MKLHSTCYTFFVLHADNHESYIYIYHILIIKNTLVISLTNINTDINTYPPVSTHASVGFLHLHMFHLGCVQLLRWLVGIWLGANMRPWQRRLRQVISRKSRTFQQWIIPNNGITMVFLKLRTILPMFFPIFYYFGVFQVFENLGLFSPGNCFWW